MNITLETHGGFAPTPGTSRPFTIDTRLLDAATAAEVESLVSAASFFDQAPHQDSVDKGAADYLTYVITVSETVRSRTVWLSEPIGDASLQRLVLRLQSLRRGAGP